MKEPWDCMKELEKIPQVSPGKLDKTSPEFIEWVRQMECWVLGAKRELNKMLRSPGPGHVFEKEVK